MVLPSHARTSRCVLSRCSQHDRPTLAQRLELVGHEAANRHEPPDASVDPDEVSMRSPGRHIDLVVEHCAMSVDASVDKTRVMYGFAPVSTEAPPESDTDLYDCRSRPTP
jgi:hypothetical protein